MWSHRLSSGYRSSAIVFASIYAASTLGFADPAPEWVAELKEGVSKPLCESMIDEGRVEYQGLEQAWDQDRKRLAQSTAGFLNDLTQAIEHETRQPDSPYRTLNRARALHGELSEVQRELIELEREGVSSSSPDAKERDEARKKKLSPVIKSSEALATELAALQEQNPALIDKWLDLPGPTPATWWSNTFESVSASDLERIGLSLSAQLAFATRLKEVDDVALTGGDPVLMGKVGKIRSLVRRIDIEVAELDFPGKLQKEHSGLLKRMERLRSRTPVNEDLLQKQVAILAKRAGRSHFAQSKIRVTMGKGIQDGIVQFCFTQPVSTEGSAYLSEPKYCLKKDLFGPRPFAVSSSELVMDRITFKPRDSNTILPTWQRSEPSLATLEQDFVRSYVQGEVCKRKPQGSGDPRESAVALGSGGRREVEPPKPTSPASGGGAGAGRAR